MLVFRTPVNLKMREEGIMVTRKESDSSGVEVPVKAYYMGFRRCGQRRIISMCRRPAPHGEFIRNSSPRIKAAAFANMTAAHVLDDA